MQRYKVVIPVPATLPPALPAKPLLDPGRQSPWWCGWQNGRPFPAPRKSGWRHDHREVEAACRAHGLNVLLTRDDHPTGTDRLAEVVALRGWSDDTLVVNVLGDEPPRSSRN